MAARAEWNHEQLVDEFSKNCRKAAYDDWRVPEQEIFELLHVVRRRLMDVCPAVVPHAERTQRAALGAANSQAV